MQVAAPRLGADVHVAVAVDVRCDAFVAPGTLQDHVLAPTPGPPVGVLPDEPAAFAPRAGAAQGALAGEDVRIAVAVEIGHAERMEVAFIRGNGMAGPVSAPTVPVLEPVHPSPLAAGVGVGHDHVVVSVLVQIDHPGTWWCP